MTTTSTAVQKKTTVDEAFALAPQHLKRLLGSQEVAERFLVIALNQIRKVPQLATCSKESILDGLVRMARLRLDPSIPNEVYLVPFKNEAMMIIGYGGLRKLVLRTPEVQDVFAQVVCQNDIYRPAESPITLCTHRLPESFHPRGRAIGYYAAALLATGLWRVVPMSKAEIAGHRDRYALGAKGTFWADNHPDKEGLTNFDKMAMKTCLRQLCSPRYLSLDADVSEALASEEALYRPLPSGVKTTMRPVAVPSPASPLDTLLEEVYGPGATQTQSQKTSYTVSPETGELLEDAPDLFAQEEADAAGGEG